MHKKRTYGTLEDSLSQLIKKLGGLESAQGYTRVKKSQLQKYCDPSEEHSKTHVPLDVVADLENAAGEPFVTEWLAKRLGLQLLAIEGNEEHDLSVNIAGVGAGASSLFEEFVISLSNDGVVDSQEAEKLILKGDRMLKAYLSLRTELMNKVNPNSGKL